VQAAIERKAIERSQPLDARDRAPSIQQQHTRVAVDTIAAFLETAELTVYLVIFDRASYEIGAEIEALTGQEVRVTVPGHTQRGGAPNPYDRVLSTRLGARAAKLIYDGKFGQMVVIRNNEITSIPLEESAGKLKVVDPNSSIVEEARLLGLSFGDR